MYNAAGDVAWPIYVVGMILILPMCTFRMQTYEPSQGGP
jgi:hypothetical protein